MQTHFHKQWIIGSLFIVSGIRCNVLTNYRYAHLVTAVFMNFFFFYYLMKGIRIFLRWFRKTRNFKLALIRLPTFSPLLHSHRLAYIALCIVIREMQKAFIINFNEFHQVLHSEAKFRVSRCSVCAFIYRYRIQFITMKSDGFIYISRLYHKPILI